MAVEAGRSAPTGVTSRSAHGQATGAAVPALYVLVVEDNADHAELTAVMLGQVRGTAWKVEYAERLGDAIARVLRPGIDAVLLDLNLPDSRGPATASRLCAEAPEVPVVVVTSHDDEEIGVEAVQAGAQDYLVKGKFDSEVLGRTLRMAVERKRAEVADARLAALVESSNDAIVGLTIDGVILSWNRGATSLYGYAESEAVGRFADFILPSETEVEGPDLLRRVWMGESPPAIQTASRRRDGGTVPVSLKLCAVRDRAGRVTGVSAVARDISELKDAWLALAESEARYRLLFEDNPQPMWVFDRATLRILAVNPAACRRYGYTREEFLELSVLDLRPPAEVPTFLAGIERGDVERKDAGVYRHRTKDGTPMDMEIQWHSVTFAGVPARLVLATDVTERRRLEEQFLQAQKMDAVGRLAGGVAHDFNNVLSVITGYAELVRRDLRPGTASARRLDGLVAATERAAGLTRQLLTFSRKQVVDRRVIDLGVVVTGIADMLRRLLGEKVQLVTYLAGGLGKVKADPGQMEQVLMNLSVNARDAMPDGGRLVIETANVELDAGFARTHLGIEAGRYVMLAVSDTGIGMDAATRQRIFEPFFTTKEAGQGTGLGLSTVYGIVQASGGSVFVYSEPGQGAAFKVYLPRVDESAPEAEVAAALPATGGTERVLLVEDEPALLDIGRELLAEAGYDVLTASAGDAALDVLSAAGPIDLMLTDVVLPGLNGPALLQEARRLRPGLKVILMSGYTDRMVADRGLSLDEGTAFLEKPFTPQALLHTVRALLDA
jgi:PAS domain S-box-containing protein